MEITGIKDLDNIIYDYLHEFNRILHYKKFHKTLQRIKSKQIYRIILVFRYNDRPGYIQRVKIIDKKKFSIRWIKNPRLN